MPKTSLANTAPHSTEAERTVIGALVMDSDKIHDIAPLLAPNDFYDPIHKDIYAAILDLYHRRCPVDFVTVCDALKKHDKLSAIGGNAFIATLTSEVSTPSHDHVCGILT